MMCFRDRTFCNAEHCANFVGCDRAYDEKQQVAAKRWWNEGCEGEAPVSLYSEPEKLDCFEPKEVE